MLSNKSHGVLKALFLILSLAVSAVYAEPKFKIGFEFQEISNLFPYFKGNYNVLRKPFFSCSSRNGTKLWSIVIDNADIEFVTEPFSNDQKGDLVKAIQSIEIASSFIVKPLKRDIDDLKKALNSQKIIKLIGTNGFGQKLGSALRERTELKEQNNLFADKGNEVFGIWKDWLKEKNPALYGNLNDSEFTKMWGSSDTINLEIIFKHAGFKEEVLSINDWINKMKSKLESEGYNTEITNDELFNLIKDKEITLRTKLTFEPQVTIQYPLEYSIPLWFDLFGYNGGTILSKFKDVIVNFKKESGDIFNKKSGLIFLHALTLYSMEPIDTNDGNLLSGLADRSAHGQADVKGLIYLMSRRPFSKMWQDIKVNEDYKQLFDSKIQENPKLKYVKENFSKTNYAEECVKNGIVQKDIKNSIVPLFNEDFYRTNNIAIDNLLSQGLISTTMIRNFDKQKVAYLDMNIFNDYYENSLESVQGVNSIHYMFDIEKKSIGQERIDGDILSPPYFLYTTDSMGKYKDNIDKRFGEAIIEARQIKNIGIYSLKQMGLVEERKGRFLTEPDTILAETKSLFDFIATILVEGKELEFLLRL